MKQARLDWQRAALLIWAMLRFGSGPLLRSLFRRPARGDSGPVRLRLAMESLGITYLKFGQFMAMRFDVLPAEYCQELATLFDTVPPVPFEVARATVEAELGKPLGACFAEFTPEALAAGSVAQVHRARTLNGEPVAVKIQRPGIRPIFEADMRNFLRLGRMIDASGVAGFISVSDMLNDFGTWTLREMDFTLEGQTADRLRETALPYEVVPEVYWDLSTSRVLTMEFLDGPNAIQVQTIIDSGGHESLEEELPGFDLHLAMRRLSFISLRQLFVTGFFHGDPHPGNVIFLPDNRVAFVDFGIFGEFTDREREVWRRHFEAFATGDIRESMYQYCRLVLAGPDGDLMAFQREAYDTLQSLYLANLNPALPPEARHVGKSSGAIFELLRTYRLRVTLNNVLFWRTLVALSASAFRLSPRFDLLDVERQFFEEYRPDPIDEIESAVREAIKEQISAQLDGELSKISEVLSIQSEGELKIDALVHASPPVERDRDSHTKGVVLVLVGVSFAVAGAATPWDATWRLAILGLALPMFAWSLVREARR